MPRRLPLTWPLPLYVNAGDAAAVNRFVRLFQETWAQLPYPVQTTLLHGWTRGNPAPEVGLQAELPQQQAGMVLRGLCTSGGCSLGFDAGYVEDLPALLVRALIAHELAHAYLFMRGDCGQAGSDEDLVDTIAEGWGFEMRGLRLRSRRRVGV